MKLKLIKSHTTITMDDTHLLWDAMLIKIKIKRKKRQDGQLQKYLGWCLGMATQKNYLDIVKKLIEEENADPNAEDDKGCTSIMIAAGGGHVLVLEYFLSLSDKVNINHQNQNGWTALMYACFGGREEVVRMLIGSPLLDVNFSNEHTPLEIACSEGFETIVSILLSHEDIQVNKSSDKHMLPPLMIACFGGHVTIVSKLLSHRDIQVNQTDEYRHTALLVACSEGHLEVVRLLIAHKDIEINKSNIGMVTPLIIAVQSGHLAIVKYFLSLSHKVSINAKTKSGWTALMYACFSGQSTHRQSAAGREYNK